MKFASNVKPFGIGTNSVLEFTEGDVDKYFSIIDDLVVLSLGMDNERNRITLECESQISNEIIKLHFTEVTKLKLIPEDTFVKYNVHDKSIDLRIIDQIIFDPEHAESDTTLTIVGLGWALELEPDNIEIEAEASNL